MSDVRKENFHFENLE